jgi:hypothetical protein
LLAAQLVGAGLPVKTVTGSKVDDLAGLTPLVAVLSGGTTRERMTFVGTKPTFYLELQVWVLQATTGWTNAQAEDALDQIESLIADVFADNVNTGNWTTLGYEDRSTVVELMVAGTPFYMERIPVVVSTSKE